MAKVKDSFEPDSNQRPKLISLGRWFESGSKESFTFAIIERAYATNSKTLYSIFVYITIFNWFFMFLNSTSCPILEKKLLSNLGNYL